MPTTSAVNGNTPAAASAGNSFASLTSSDFLRVMINELANQDPLNPQDSAKLVEQFSNLRNIESQLKLQEKLEALVMQNQVASAGGLIGKLVSGIDDTNTAVAGLVTSVRVQDGKAFLELDTGKTLAMDRLVQIADLPE